MKLSKIKPIIIITFKIIETTLYMCNVKICIYLSLI